MKIRIRKQYKEMICLAFCLAVFVISSIGFIDSFAEFCDPQKLWSRIRKCFSLPAPTLFPTVSAPVTPGIFQWKVLLRASWCGNCRRDDSEGLLQYFAILQCHVFFDSRAQYHFSASENHFFMGRWTSESVNRLRINGLCGPVDRSRCQVYICGFGRGCFRGEDNAELTQEKQLPRCQAFVVQYGRGNLDLNLMIDFCIPKTCRFSNVVILKNQRDVFGKCENDVWDFQNRILRSCHPFVGVFAEIMSLAAQLTLSASACSKAVQRRPTVLECWLWQELETCRASDLAM